MKAANQEEQEWLTELGQAFHKIAGSDEKIQISELKKALQFKESFFAERYFELIDSDGSGEIDFNEFLAGAKRLLEKDDTEKLRFLFQVYDVNDDGTLSPEEIGRVLSSCQEESELKMSQETLKELSQALFDSADVNKDGNISFEEFKDQLLQYPSITKNLSINPSNWIKVTKTKSGPQSEGIRGYFSYYHIRNNLRLLVFLLMYLLLNAGLFVLNAVLYKDKNVAVIIARGCGMCLNFNSAFVMVFMLRAFLTWLRETWMAAILPLDDSIFLHKLVGYNIFFLTIVHTLCHIANAALLSDSGYKNLTVPDILFTVRAHVGWLSYSAYLTGWVLTFVLVLMVLLSLPFIRRKGYFEVFYFSHYLYIAYQVLLILHGPIYRYFIILPGAAFIVEKLIMAYKMCKNINQSDIIKVELLPSKVVHLTINRPRRFLFRNGDYMFILIPEVSQREWHPFTISSAPENAETLSVHIRSLGNWTTGLYKKFEAYDSHNDMKKKAVFDKGHKVNVIKVEEGIQQTERQGHVIHTSLPIFLDGPYGTPTRDITRAEHAVLVAAGIGVTPFASILQSLVLQRRKCAPTSKSPLKDSLAGSESMNSLQKVDFIWINRHATAVEWFIRLLTQLELEEMKHEAFDRFLDTHLYITGAKKASDLQGLGLQMALELIYQKENRDLITGLRTRTKPGRPDWDKIFQGIRDERKGRVHVFFCGPPTLAKTLRLFCQKYDFEFSKENF